MLHTSIKTEPHITMCITLKNINMKEEGMKEYVHFVPFVNLKIIENNTTYCLRIFTCIMKEYRCRKIITILRILLSLGIQTLFKYICNVSSTNCEYLVLNIFDIFIFLKKLIILKNINSDF